MSAGLLAFAALLSPVAALAQAANNAAATVAPAVSQKTGNKPSVPSATGAAGEPVTTIRSQSHLVLVPTLVTDGKGNVIYGLKAKDFAIFDNGLEQNVHLDDMFGSKPVSIVVTVQTGGRAPAVLGSGCAMLRSTNEFTRQPGKCRSALHGIGLMLETFLADNGSQMALVSFDSTVRLRQNFTPEINRIISSLDRLPPGNGEGLIINAVQYSLSLLQRLPETRRKVLVVISDHVDDSDPRVIEAVARKLVASNVEVYMIAFTESDTEQLKGIARVFGPLIRAAIMSQQIGMMGPGGMGGGPLNGRATTSTSQIGGTQNSGNTFMNPQMAAAGTQEALPSVEAMKAHPDETPMAADAGKGTTGVKPLGGESPDDKNAPGGPGGMGPGGLGTEVLLGPVKLNVNAAVGGIGGGGPMGGGAPGGGAPPGGGAGGSGGSPGGGHPGGPPGGGGALAAGAMQSLVGLIHKASEEARSNTPQAIANLTGGEYVLFDDPKGLDEALGLLANHAHNRYQLSFQPLQPTAGPHKIEVYVRDGGGAMIAARAGYWLEGDSVQDEKTDAPAKAPQSGSTTQGK